jgi:hypothetical protein
MSNIITSFSQISTITDATVFPVVENGLSRRATGQEVQAVLEPQVQQVLPARQV